MPAPADQGAQGGPLPARAAGKPAQSAIPSRDRHHFPSEGGATRRVMHEAAWIGLPTEAGNSLSAVWVTCIGVPTPGQSASRPMQSLSAPLNRATPCLGATNSGVSTCLVSVSGARFAVHRSRSPRFITLKCGVRGWMRDFDNPQFHGHVHARSAGIPSSSFPLPVGRPWPLPIRPLPGPCPSGARRPLQPLHHRPCRRRWTSTMASTAGRT